MDLLLNKSVVDSHSLHKVSHSFPKELPSERISIATEVAIVDIIESTIQVGGHTPKGVLLDTGAQPTILGVQFAKKMGMLDSKLQKFMWQFLSQPYFEKSVRMRLTLQKWELGSPPGLPKL